MDRPRQATLVFLTLLAVGRCLDPHSYLCAGICHYDTHRPCICTRSLQKVCSHAIGKLETFTEEDIRYKKHCTEGNDISVPFKVGTLGLTQFRSPSAAQSYFPESHLWSEISSLSKAILILGKARSHRAPNLGCSGAESPG